MPFLKGKTILISRVANLENSAKKHGLRHAIFNPPKDKYIGEWTKDVKQGKGTLLTRTGRLYEGDWERNYRHGFGVLAHRDENDIFHLEYRGDWKNGKMHGYGARHYLDGSYYVGFFKNSNRHGYGQMWYADGRFYDGDWFKDKKEGMGLYVDSNGNRYEGYFMNDMKHGKGRYLHLDSGQIQDGVWYEDLCVFSVIEDIPFRQTAVSPTPYPVRQVQLEEPDNVCGRREYETLHGIFNCSSSDISFPDSLMHSVEFV